ncbi:MAG: RsmE family RNA methyltransferase [Dehalococcoidia bacterium]
MHRLFIPPEWIGQSGVVIAEEQAHHLRDVLRVKYGEEIVLLDDSGYEYLTRIVDIKRNLVNGEIVEKRLCSGEPEVEITCYQALLKRGKLDIVLQKGTEIGVKRFVPIVCQRSVARDPGKFRQARWQKIVREAAEQSGRGRIPAVDPLADFSQACEQATGISLLPWEDEPEMGIGTALKKAGNINQLNIFIGPEGGFTIDEIELARKHGIIPVTLGKRILRAETAGMVAASVICYEKGEMGKLK